ncbi:uncharacterized protein I303_104919 [Kwoniella dejecticola CBS 10117]|uniref:Major facilitator superfamily (MFS) profile domain-containing protein n=1 Tax=Kwoniella dejecticola CBS 10117 TaxID=1296121 RepID=A0A1A6A3Z9_9TREE|nr:uncharacterized protein I303_05635 [Kwoniella dejecticola CBS 10117]OBR84776.1 hypothetical protein I303_05635 [Kwoniella dejecticola CBS 10117]
MPISDVKANEKDVRGVVAVDAVDEGLKTDNHNAEDVILAEESYSEEEYKRLRWKFDLTLMPILMLTYGLQYADKVSLSSGVVFGLKTDTHLTGDQYSLLTVYFYCAYLAGQIPMSFITQRLPIGRALGGTVIIWGMVVIGTGLCNNYLQLSMCRVLLGWMECYVTPGFLLIIASWYKRSEATLRSCMYFAMNQFLGGIFNVIIYAIAKKAAADGGIAGWRAINFFLGSLTVVAGVLVFVFVGIPSDVWWLKKEQKKMAHSRIISNGTGDAGQHPWRWTQIIECFKDPQYYLIILFNLTATIPNGVITTFTSLIFKGFGFTPLQSILYQLPGNAMGFTVIIGTAIAVTYVPRCRFPLAITWTVVEMVVFLYVGLAKNASKWQLWAAFSFHSVLSCSTFLVWSIMPINSAGRTKKSFIGATALIAYCAGNMIGSQTLRASDAPRYLKGLTANAIVMAINALVLVSWWTYLLWENKKRDAAFERSGLTVEEGEWQNKVAAETDITDRQNPHFRYLA